MQEPTRRLSPRARWVWRLQQIVTWGVLVIASVFVADMIDGLGLLPYAVLAALVVAVIGVPALRWRRWRWDVQDEGIDIRQGTLTIRRTLVPWVRVQHVDTRRGLLEQAFGLATVVVHTAAGGHTIPLLAFEDAELLRDRIAELARGVGP